MKPFFFLTFLLISTTTYSSDKKNLTTELTLDMAKSYVEKAMACGKKNKWAISVAVVNAEGNLIAFQRGDGSYTGSIEASIGKAKSSSAFKRPTKAFVEALKEGRQGVLSLPGVIAIEGGVPIYSNEKLIGAIGISGAKALEDEQCAIAALE